MVRDLVRVAQIAERFGTTTRTALRWAKLPDFPVPIDLELADGSRVPTGGRVWDLAEVEKWAREHLSETGTLPRSGRPRKQL